MPVIKGISKAAALTSERRQALRDAISRELSGKTSPDGPIVFEVPLEQSEKFDVIAVWKEFEGIRPEDSTKLILDAYGDAGDKISLAMGATYQEAIGQHLLPYGLAPMAKHNQAGADELRGAMLEEGGFEQSNGKVTLQFPTFAMAEAACQRLSARFPDLSWSILESGAQT